MHPPALLSMNMCESTLLSPMADFVFLAIRISCRLGPVRESIREMCRRLASFHFLNWGRGADREMTDTQRDGMLENGLK